MTRAGDVTLEERFAAHEASYVAHLEREEDHFEAVMNGIGEVKSEVANLSVWKAQVESRHSYDAGVAEGRRLERTERDGAVALTWGRRDVQVAALGVLVALVYLGLQAVGLL